jgi:hypothetical protein
MDRAYSKGSLLSFPAGMILMEIYSTYEHRGVDARRVGERLLKEYPNNPDVGVQLAERQPGDRGPRSSSGTIRGGVET